MWGVCLSNYNNQDSLSFGPNIGRRNGWLLTNTQSQSRPQVVIIQTHHSLIGKYIFFGKSQTFFTPPPLFWAQVSFSRAPKGAKIGFTSSLDARYSPLYGLLPIWWTLPLPTLSTVTPVNISRQIRLWVTLSITNLYLLLTSLGFLKVLLLILVNITNELLVVYGHFISNMFCKYLSSLSLY